MIRFSSIQLFRTVLIAVLFLGALQPRAATPGIGNAFQFNSFLIAGTKAANGVFDLEFQLFDQAIGGTQIGNTSNTSGVRVTKGSYSAVVDFGANTFDGQSRWVQVRYRKSGTASFFTAINRVQILPVPYAMMSAKADHAVSADFVTGGVNAIHADTADFATNAGHATTAGSATSAGTATFASSAGTATAATFATSATVASTADAAALAAEAFHAEDADHALAADFATNADFATTAGASLTAAQFTGQQLYVRTGTRNITGTLTSATEQIMQMGVASVEQGVFENQVNFPEAFDTTPIVFLSYLGTDAAGGSDWQDTIYNSPSTGIYLQANQVNKTRFVLRHGIGGPSSEQTHKIAWLAIGGRNR